MKTTRYTAASSHLGERHIIINGQPSRPLMEKHLCAAYSQPENAAYGFRMKRPDEAPVTPQPPTSEVCGEYIAKLFPTDAPENADYGTSDRIQVRKSSFLERCFMPLAEVFSKQKE